MRLLDSFHQAMSNSKAAISGKQLISNISHPRT
ncbi:hypothetical protein swp_4199 [Shewanella piezotolerans WP3]|uniref:Uncharacterized protein n=1 Tax=Shewanella piezotolerans (strain WP3 / JCM 13877) TaxID=225849 RepID=B8CU02_SHEPW|nr:hypothetical protein swp_4199 [Shewanella piezotolerans WP3]